MRRRKQLPRARKRDIPETPLDDAGIPLLVDEDKYYAPSQSFRRRNDGAGVVGAQVLRKILQDESPRLHVPRVDPRVQLSRDAFKQQFRDQGRAVVFSFESIRHLGFESIPFTLRELREKFPFDPSTDQAERFRANAKLSDSQNIGSAFYAIEGDGEMRKFKNQMREYPRNVHLPPALKEKLLVQEPSVMPEDTVWQKPTLWMGTSHSDTKFHHDCCDNFVVMLAGTKRFTLSPPSSWRNLAPKCIGERQALCWASVAHPGYEEKMSSKDKRAMKKVPTIVIDLRPGEILYMPAGWFHHIRNVGPTVMVNWWTKSRVK